MGDELRPALVRLGKTIGGRRYTGQHPTEAAHEFADAALEVLGQLESAAPANRITEEMGALLWRRSYQAQANLMPQVTMLPETLETLLRQAGVPEPDDDVVFGPGTSLVHGRTMSPIKRP